MTSIIKRAAGFARKVHVGQVRKYIGESYFNHVQEVASLVRDYHEDYYMIAAAYLHDVVEDTPVTNEEIRSRFGDIVAGYVSGLTDVSKPEDGNRAARKKIDREHTWSQPFKTQVIKCADLVSNSSTILIYDPSFAKVYLEEKRLLLDGMKSETKKHPLWKRAFEFIE